MIIVGEKINTSIKKVSDAVSTGNAAYIADLARRQVQAGAHYIDVNAGTFVDQEAECLSWLVNTVQEAVDMPLCIDSANPEAISRAMAVHRGEPVINSVSLEPDRFRDLFPVITAKPCKVVALCMAETSMPVTTKERVDVAQELVKKLMEGGIPVNHIFVDPLIQPVSVDQNMAKSALEAISHIMKLFPGIHTICGLSNVSFGLPVRRLINRCFFLLAVAYGLTAAILDPLDKRLMSRLITAEMLLGKDEYCTRFMEAYRNGIISED